MTLYQFKFADCEHEIEQIHRLNYIAFVEEIPQHAPNPERRLVDQFHAQNCYAIGLVGEEVVAMLALRSQRPFSLDKKLADLDRYLPPHRSPCEIRLLYIRPAHRNGKVLRGLMELVAEYATVHGHDIGLISGTTRQQKLYRHLGFQAFGPLVGQEPARFQPMYLTLGAALRHTPWVEALSSAHAMLPSTEEAAERSTAGAQQSATVKPRRVEPPSLPRYDPPLNYLPGPVNMPQTVLQAMQRPPLSHRSETFLADVAQLQARLAALVGAKQVDLLTGSGTLANEAVAAQLRLLDAPGLVLVNGEFGRRLADQAARWQLPHRVLATTWGCPLDLAEVEEALTADQGVAWLWCVHCETSTGMVNDLTSLARLCARYDVKLCVDCISSIGAVPVNLADVFLATGTSGKALGAMAGLALVFANAPLAPAPDRLPSYLDLGGYRAANGVPFTMPANLVYALGAALDYFGDYTNRHTVEAADALRRDLRCRGMEIVTDDALASPAVTTIALPPSVASTEVGARLARQGFLTSYQSRYLVERNWLQICLMGAFRSDALADLAASLHEAVARDADADDARRVMLT